ASLGEVNEMGCVSTSDFDARANEECSRIQSVGISHVLGDSLSVRIIGILGCYAISPHDLSQFILLVISEVLSRQSSQVAIRIVIQVLTRAAVGSDPMDPFRM